MANTVLKFKNSIINLIDNVNRFLFDFPRQLIYPFTHKEFYSHESYFPESSRVKSPRKILFEQVLDVFKYGAINKFYFPYGFDVKSRKEMDEYYVYRVFKRDRDKRLIAEDNSSTFILRNKLFFGMFASYFGVPTCENIFVLNGDECFDLRTKQRFTLEFAFSNLVEGHYFMKELYGECGVGIYKIEVKSNSIFVNNEIIDYERLKMVVGSGVFLLQNKVIQHHQMSELYSCSVNTLRLVTVKSKSTGTVRPFPSILRVGANGSFVDNTSQGGLAVGVNLHTGNLLKYGFYKPEFGLKTTEHPNSHIKFDEFTVPYIKEAQEMACFLHSMLPNIYSIGWDIAIGENGPVFIEGNDNWEINGPQICNGGLKKLFREYSK